MRLIHVETMKMRQFSERQIPEYAILSHRWGEDKDEVSFSDMTKGSSKKVGMAKVLGCCKQAKKDKIKYIWIDSCCIKKDSSKELEESINSMFQWYKNAKVCYTYMSDVPKSNKPWELGPNFYSSSWFLRGWTLQELLAPKELQFYDQQWNFIGTRNDLSKEIGKITNIPRGFLVGCDFHKASVAQRMSWAANRKTKRKEDMAYCLLGIFNISMSMIYGEGDKAFERLQLKIMEQTTDDSILAWGISETNLSGESTKVTKAVSAGVFASSPKDFSGCGRIVPHTQNPNPSSTFAVASGFVHTSLTIHYNEKWTDYASLNCSFEGNDDQVIAIPLYTSPSISGYIRPKTLGPILVAKPPVGHLSRLRIRIDRQIGPGQAKGTTGIWLCAIGYQKLGLKLAETYPPLEWENSRALLNSNGDSKSRVITQLIRFTSDAAKSHDLIVAIERNPTKSASTMRSFIMQSVKGLELADIEKSLPFMDPKCRDTKKADNGTIEVTVDQTHENGPEGVLCFVSLDRTNKALTVANKHPAILTAKLKYDFMDSLKKEHLARSTEHPSIKNLATLRDRRDTLENKMLAIEQEEWKIAEKKKSVQTEIKSLTDQIVAEEAKTQGRLKSYEKHKTNRSQAQNMLDGKTAYSHGNPKSQPRFLSTKGEVAQGPGNWFEKIIQRQLERASTKSYSWPVEVGQDMENLSPLIWAVANTKTEIVDLLLEKGSDTEVKDKHGTTSLSAAAYYGNTRIVKTLLKHGAELEARNKLHLTPLIYASYGGRQEIVTLLLDKGAKIEARTASKSTALGLAASKGHHDVVNLLLERGANIESKDEEGNTPLARAASGGHAKTVTQLVKKRARIETRNFKQQTPLAMAVKNKHGGVAKMLIDAGAKD
ncbi:hypothetical protein FSST1_012676 [Fusarium sambucinum]